jgi:hypothetical protein
MLKARTIVATLFAIALLGDAWGQSPQELLPQPPPENQRIAQHEKDKSDSEWWLVGLTGVLAFVGLLQTGVFTWQGIQLKRTVTHLAISERAHVSGGANRARKNDGSEFLVVTVNNYGKTATTIGTIAATICEKHELTSFPGWKIKDWKGYVFGPVHGQVTDVILPHEQGKVIVGRIWYRDIFNKCYSVGFVLNTDDLTAVGEHESYWEEREEKNLRPES